MSAPRVEHRYERVLPSGCAHIVLTLPRDFLTDCLEGGSEQRTAPVLIVGQRSVYEIIATADLVDLASVLFAPGALPALVADCADLLSNRNVPLDQVWRGYAHIRILCAASFRFHPACRRAVTQCRAAEQGTN